MPKLTTILILQIVNPSLRVVNHRLKRISKRKIIARYVKSHLKRQVVIIAEIVQFLYVRSVLRINFKITEFVISVILRLTIKIMKK